LLRKLGTAKRKAAGLKQAERAKILKRGLDYVSDGEIGSKVVAVVELKEWADASGFNTAEVIKRIY
jgi:hypothetical protein